VRWRRYTSPDRVVDLDAACGDPLRHWGGMQFKTAYALTHVRSPVARACELRVVGDSNAKVWLNDELVLSERDDHQGYLELRDAFGFRIPVRLEAGWNRLLLKVSQGMRYGGTFGFVARFCDADGLPLTDLHAAASPEAAPGKEGGGERWYRLRVPAGTTALRLPPGAERAELYLDGERVDAVATRTEATLALRLPAGDELRDFPVFELGPAERPLGPITHSGLAFYAGTLVYETDFDLPAGLDGRRLELDLGTVGVAAAVALNGIPVGERAWRPYTLEVTAALRPGRNELRVEVANTRSSERARGPHQLALWALPVRGPALLDRLDENGLHGPVRILAR
jgi:hypothetical protein